MSQKTTVAACVAIACIVITGIAWQKIPAATPSNHRLRDTVPITEKKQHNKTAIRGDLDKALEQVEKAQENLEQQLQNGGFDKIQLQLQKAQEQLNTTDIHLQLEKAMKEIDIQKLQLEDQLKNIDIQKIQEETQSALQKINWEKMQKELEKAQVDLKNNIDYKKIENEVRLSLDQSKKAMAELKNIDMEKIKLELERSKEEMKRNEGKMQEEMERAKKDIQQTMKRDFKKEMEKAREEIVHSKKQLQEYKNMLGEMVKEGLLSSDKEYNIEYKEGNLFINGNKQPETIANKYKHYFQQEHVILSRDNNDDNKIIDL